MQEQEKDSKDIRSHQKEIKTDGDGVESGSNKDKDGWGQSKMKKKDRINQKEWATQRPSSSFMSSWRDVAISDMLLL